MDEVLERLSVSTGAFLREQGWTLATAESCTGGWVAQVVTDTAGSSQWFERGFVTYSNRAKQELLGVSAETLARHGAVSEQTVQAMVQGALARSAADVVLAITGIAGPGGATPGKPVGTVWLGWARRQGPVLTRCERFTGTRREVRRQAVLAALEGLRALEVTRTED